MPENVICIDGRTWIYMMFVLLTCSVAATVWICAKKILPRMKLGEKILRKHLVMTAVLVLVAVLSIIAMW